MQKNNLPKWQTHWLSNCLKNEISSKTKKCILEHKKTYSYLSTNHLSQLKDKSNPKTSGIPRLRSQLFRTVRQNYLDPSLSSEHLMTPIGPVSCLQTNVPVFSPVHRPRADQWPGLRLRWRGQLDRDLHLRPGLRAGWPGPAQVQGRGLVWPLAPRLYRSVAPLYTHVTSSWCQVTRAICGPEAHCITQMSREQVSQ